MLPVRMRAVLRYGLLPLDTFLDRFTQNPLLRSILSVQAGDHGMAPSRASADPSRGLAGPVDGLVQGGGRDGKIRQANRPRVRLGTGVKRISSLTEGAPSRDWKTGDEVRADIVAFDGDPGDNLGAPGGATTRQRPPSPARSQSEVLGIAQSLTRRGHGPTCRRPRFREHLVHRSSDIEAAYRLGRLDDLSRV